MEPGKWALEEALAAIESETRHLVHAEARPTPTAETDMDIAPLVHEVGATSIVEIEKADWGVARGKGFSAVRGGASSARDGALHQPHADGFGLGKNYL
jgi:hypothetical protein